MENKQNYSCEWLRKDTHKMGRRYKRKYPVYQTKAGGNRCTTAADTYPVGISDMTCR